MQSSTRDQNAKAKVSLHEHAVLKLPDILPITNCSTVLNPFAMRIRNNLYRKNTRWFCERFYNLFHLACIKNIIPENCYACINL